MTDTTLGSEQQAAASPGGPRRDEPGEMVDAPPSRVAQLVLQPLGWIAARVYPVVLILGVWQLLVTTGLVTPFTLPAPSRVWDVAAALWQTGELQSSGLITLRRVLASFALALVVGTALGILIGRLRAFRLAARPVVAFFFPTPKVAIYPALVILLGLGTASKIALGFAEAVFPIILATSAAASQIEPRLLWSAQAFGTSRPQMLTRVVLPAALPGVLTGGRIGLVGAIVGVFLGELIVGSQGLGHQMATAYRTLETAEMYVAVVLISAGGFVLDRLFLLARSRLLAWSDEEH